MFLSGEKVDGEKCISAQGSSVKGSSQQSSTPGPKVKGGGPLFSGQGPFFTGGWLVNNTTPEDKISISAVIIQWGISCFHLTSLAIIGK